MPLATGTTVYENLTPILTFPLRGIRPRRKDGGDTPPLIRLRRTPTRGEEATRTLTWPSEPDDALDLTPIASGYLQESRTGRNVLDRLAPLLRQSIYSRVTYYLSEIGDSLSFTFSPNSHGLFWRGKATHVIIEH